MTATNHALTGAAIGLVVGQPWLAIPLAFVSHFICDAIPHFKVNTKNNKHLKTKWFQNYLITEFLICVLIVALLAYYQPYNWLLAALCAFFAASPDLFSIRQYRQSRTNKKWQPTVYGKFATNIQWFERPIGAVVEVAWLVAMIIIIVPFLT